MRSGARTKLSELAASIDAVAVHLRDRAPTFFLWPLLYAVSIGCGAFVLRYWSSIPALAQNKLPQRQSLEMVFWVGAAAAALGVLYGVAVGVERRVARRRGVSPRKAKEVVAGYNRRLLPLLALPLVEALALPGIERDGPKRTIFLTVLVAAILGVTAYAWLRTAPSSGDGLSPPPARVRVARIGAALAVAALWAGYAFFFARLSITNHHALNTRTISLGFYDNIFYHSIHGRPLGCSLIKAGYHGSAHFDPILLLVAPLYLLHPRAELLLVLQSLWLGAGVVPVYLMARQHHASRLAAIGLATMYALHPALHGANLYEFHSLTLAAPIVLWLLYFLEAGRALGYWLLLGAALLVREDVPILMGFVGVYAVLSRRPGMARVGWITILSSLVYFIVVKRWFMTSPDVFMSGKDAYSFAYNYDELMPNHDGATGMLVSLVTNPVFVLETMLTEPKILYLATLFVPLAFLPFFARPGRVMLGWGLVFCLLATRPALYSVYFHYPCILIPVAFALTPVALRAIEERGVRTGGLDGKRLSGALLVAAFAASVLCSWKFGGILENTTFRAGYLPVARALTGEERETYAWLREQVDRIPSEARVGFTNRIGAHAANRMGAFFYPERADVDLLLLDEAELQGTAVEKHEANLAAGIFELVARHDKLAVYRRK